MGASRKAQPRRRRIGKVSYYYRAGGWHVYYLDGLRQVRRRVADDEATAAQIAAQLNGQLAAAAPTFYAFTPIPVAELRQRFLEHHEHVLRSSLATVRRYQAATQHLQNFAQLTGRNLRVHEISADDFARYLRGIKVHPNGHRRAAQRPLRDKGVRFILETCRSMYGYAAKKRHLPPYADNPFSGLGGKRCKIEDAKPIFIFDQQTERAFFQAADPWSFAVHFALSKSALRPGELVHLLVEDLDLDGGWLHVRNKSHLGWRTKNRRERSVPLHGALAAVLRAIIAGRKAGPVFLRPNLLVEKAPLVAASEKSLTQELQRRVAAAERDSCQPLTRESIARIARCVWRDAGATKPDTIRTSFIRITARIGLPEVTCPKAWRHTFATLLQDANVDPLVRQITMGHAPTSGPEGALGMTSRYTHTRPTTQALQIVRALELWPSSLELARSWAAGCIAKARRRSDAAAGEAS